MNLQNDFQDGPQDLALICAVNIITMAGRGDISFEIFVMIEVKSFIPDNVKNDFLLMINI